MPMIVRDAMLEDAEDILAIYNHAAINTTAVWTDGPVDLDSRRAWIRARREAGYPVLVAMKGRDVVGFASFGDFRPWPGYRFTVEGTVHIDSNFRGQGVGSALLQALIALATIAGKHTMIAGVDAENSASLRFLERFGFERVAHLREVGYKFDRFLDLIFLQYWITPPANK